MNGKLYLCCFHSECSFVCVWQQGETVNVKLYLCCFHSECSFVCVWQQGETV